MSEAETPEPTLTPIALWQSLSPRETEVALLLARGEANRDIAKMLGVSIKTIDTHRGRILKKLGCKNNVKLALFCVRLGVTVHS